MTPPLCERCRALPATLYGVPAEASLSHAPDGTVLDPHREVMFAIEPEKWMRLCEACTDSLVAARGLAAAFDLATWKDPRDAASRRAI
jgi:hypothetical protein